MGDIQAKFYQVKVAKEDFLRFIWWSDGDLSKELTDCTMTVHMFGAAKRVQK